VIHPDVAEAAAVGAQDPATGQAIAANSATSPLVDFTFVNAINTQMDPSPPRTSVLVRRCWIGEPGGGSLRQSPAGQTSSGRSAC